MKTTEYLDAAKAKLEISSDYALAPHLELSRAAVSKLRNGIAIMSNTTAAKLAGILELEPLKVIADAELERGTNDELWKRIRDAAVIVLGALGLQLQPAPADAAALTTILHSRDCAPELGGRFNRNTHCAAFVRWLARLFGVPGFADGALA